MAPNITAAWTTRQNMHAEYEVLSRFQADRHNGVVLAVGPERSYPYTLASECHRSVPTARPLPPNTQ